MQDSINQPVSSNECAHSQTVDDDQEGTTVCLNCCRVLDQLYFCNYEIGNGNGIDLYTSKDFCDSFIFLKDVCANSMIPYNMVSYAHDYFKVLKNNHLISGKNFSNKVIASYALYETLSNHSISRSAREIELITGTKCASLWKVENCLNLEEIIGNPEDFVERYCTALDIDFFKMKIIKGIVSNMSQFNDVWGFGGIRPDSIVAAVIYLYCKEINFKISMKSVCQVCSVSYGNIYKIVNRLPSKISKNISSLYVV
jgi:transcription initiation factor TFIIIB Brf1 subunit/transcription initiation factor TFIIB